jgi:putative transcriptional regulator
LHKDGAVDENTMREIHSICLPDIKEYSAFQIIELRKKTHPSQVALAVVINLFPSTVQKWERGVKKPSGSSQRLFDSIERKGIEENLVNCPRNFPSRNFVVAIRAAGSGKAFGEIATLAEGFHYIDNDRPQQAILPHKAVIVFS